MRFVASLLIVAAAVFSMAWQPFVPAAAAGRVALPRTAQGRLSTHAARVMTRHSAQNGSAADAAVSQRGIGSPDGFAARALAHDKQLDPLQRYDRRLSGAGRSAYPRRRAFLPLFAPGIGTLDPALRARDKDDLDNGYGGPLVDDPDDYPGTAGYGAPPVLLPYGPMPPIFYPALRRPVPVVPNAGPRIITIGSPARKRSGKPLPQVIYGWPPARGAD